MAAGSTKKVATTTIRLAAITATANSGDKMSIYRIIPVAFMLASCASASTIPLAKDTIQITARAAPACGGQGAEKVAIKQAAVETLQRGYDKFIIVNTSASTNIQVVGHSPVYANTYGNTTTFTGGAPVYGGSHNQGIVVKMFKNGQAGSSNALDAKTSLGPEWEKAVKEKTISCL